MANAIDISKKFNTVVRTFYAAIVEYNDGKAKIIQIKRGFHHVETLLEMINLEAQVKGLEVDFVSKASEVTFACFEEAEEIGEMEDGSPVSLAVFNMDRPHVIVWTDHTTEFPRKFQGLNKLLDLCRNY